MFKYVVNSELPGYDEKIQQRYIYVQNLYRRYSIEKIYRHPKKATYCIEFKASPKTFIVFGYSKELSMEDADKRIKAFENALAKDFATFEYIKEKNSIGQWLLLLASNKRVWQLYRQRAIDVVEKLAEWEEYKVHWGE